MSAERPTVDLRRERLMMRAFQNRLVGPLLRRVASPQDIITDGMAFWSSRLILTAVERGVFTLLAQGPLSAHELVDHLGWHPRAATTALDALVSGGLLRRDRAGRYANTLRASVFRDPVALKIFLFGRTGISTGEVTLLAARFPWKRFNTFADVGCAQGALPVRVALTNPHLQGTGFDLPVVEPIFTDYVKSFGLDDRLDFVAGDFFTGDLPSADVISFGHVFHGQSHEQRRELVAKAREALPAGGALIVYDAMTTSGRSANRYHSLLSSLNIMLETRDGYESTTTDCSDLLRANGFSRVKVRHLIGPTSMVYGLKH